MARRPAIIRTEREENEQLRGLVAALTHTIASLEGTVASLQSELVAQRAANADTQRLLEKAVRELEALQRRFLGPKPEKLPRPSEDLAKSGPKPAKDPAEAKEKRSRNREKQRQVESREIPHPVSEDKRTCPCCGRRDLKVLGKGRRTELFEYIPGRLELQIHIQETLTCPCGEYVVTADAPVKAFEQGRYGPSFIAHLTVSKVLDALPLHRLEKRFQRSGVSISRSTMTDLFHNAAEMLRPIVERLFELVASAPVVQADETSIKIQDREKRGFLWTFLTGDIVVYRFSTDRSGETPAKVLDGTTGVLVVDGYTGYNKVTQVKGRLRAGCLAHARRHLFEARELAPEAIETAMHYIARIYAIEAAVRKRNLVGSPRHARLRTKVCRKWMNKLKAWLEVNEKLHPPRSKLGQAIGYVRRNWDRLTVFLDDVRVPPDNNASERALRAAALGRKNFLFVGNPRAGDNLAVLYSLVMTCVANGVDPEKYLADVLIRIHERGNKLDDLLPHNWSPAT